MWRSFNLVYYALLTKVLISIVTTIDSFKAPVILLFIRMVIFRRLHNDLYMNGQWRFMVSFGTCWDKILAGRPRVDLE